VSICTFILKTEPDPLPADLVRLREVLHEDVIQGRRELRKSNLTNASGDWQDQAMRGLIQEP
jgi:hypothetical protein